jgi:hypothetical protein
MIIRRQGVACFAAALIRLQYGKYFQNTSVLFCDKMIIIRFRINYVIYNLTQNQLSRIPSLLTLDNRHTYSFRNSLCFANTPHTMVIDEHNSLFAQSISH